MDSKLKNHDGFYVSPSNESVQAAATGAKWDNKNGFYQILTNAPGATSWPITAATFILVRKDTEFEKIKQIFKFMDFNYRTGEFSAMYLDFVIMPNALTHQVRASWKNISDSSGKLAWK